MVVHRRLDPDGLLGGAFSGVRRDSSYSSGGKTEDSLGCACVGPPGDDATAHRTWDHGRRSSSSSSSTHRSPTHRSPTHRSPRQAGPTPPATRPGLLPGPEVQPVRGRCTAATHSAPARYLVAWHQDKNPQDGSCGTGCPQAQPGNGHVFTHSLTHSPTHSLARLLTRVSPGPTPATPRGHPPRENGAVP